MNSMLVRSVAIAAVVVAASVASAAGGVEMSGLSMGEVAGGFARSGVPFLLVGMIGLAGRRQRPWYEDPDVIQDLQAGAIAQHF